ncbi:hypothetical protein WR25_00713 [Diploscapter pachys]|uniref:Uncharacterized protein n=1 Tax=Diploscapter pachys TaxID=2018661 RepID=A0A2A2LBW2_9BILA|nr:hypothetical protein WR25_00713 [Diploscapter pachys]
MGRIGHGNGEEAEGNDGSVEETACTDQQRPRVEQGRHFVDAPFRQQTQHDRMSFVDLNEDEVALLDQNISFPIFHFSSCRAHFLSLISSPSSAIHVQHAISA